MRLTIASRKSDLARMQAHSVGRALETISPDIEINFLFRESLGDKNLVDPLWRMPEKGVFTEDFYQDLVSGQVDMVVHSWKDLPTEVRKETDIVATLPRADMRDMLLMRRDVWPKALVNGQLRLFSSSPRRAYNLGHFLKDALPAGINKIDFESVRGNVPTRIEKLFNSETVHGLIVAKAALDRLLEAEAAEFKDVQKQLRARLNSCLMMILPLSLNPTAAAQGALAIEISKKRGDLKDVLAKINCQSTFEAVARERTILSSYGGGCHQKVGVSVLTRPYGDFLFVRALTDQGEKVDRVEFKSRHFVRAGVVAPAGAASNEPGFKMTKVTIDKIFPARPSENAWFDRVEIEAVEPLLSKVTPNSPNALWIAKEDALPSKWRLGAEQVIWCSGVETWKKLAARHFWVTGCSESLGEAEDPRVNTVLGYETRWLKLSHSGGHKTPGFQTLGTYKLVPKSETPDLTGKTHFYWMSASSFDRALEVFPNEIKKGVHACGPGHTFELITQKLTACLGSGASGGHGGTVNIFASHKDWLEQVLK